MVNNSKLLIPLDFDSTALAIETASTLRNVVYGYKVGLQLINSAGFDVFDLIREATGPDSKIFYDCKFHDIPNTVYGACKAAAGRGVWMLNVHATGGLDMMKSAVDGSRSGAVSGFDRPLVIAVTVLTSISENTLNGELHVSKNVRDYAKHLAVLAQKSGCDGVVASPQETAAIRSECGEDFIIVTPGVRPLGADMNDQKRVMTPEEAVGLGSNYLVVGRPITAAKNPLLAATEINRAVEMLN